MNITDEYFVGWLKNQCESGKTKIYHHPSGGYFTTIANYMLHIYEGSRNLIILRIFDGVSEFSIQEPDSFVRPDSPFDKLMKEVGKEIKFTVLGNRLRDVLDYARKHAVAPENAKQEMLKKIVGL